MGSAGALVAIRVDASPTIGVGHLARCLTLAEALRAQGAEVWCFSTGLLPEWAARVEAAGVTLTVLASASPQSMRAALAGRPWQWLVVDHYGCDADWVRTACPDGCRVLVIDDLANRRLGGDVLLDQNYLPHRARDYEGLTPASMRLLLGPAYALLRPEYTAARRGRSDRPDGAPIRRVAVSFGGADPWELSAMTLAALSAPDLAALEVWVVAGAAGPSREHLLALAAARGRTRVLDPQPHLAEVFAWADLAIGAAGSTCWERLCVGVPTIMVTVAENQRGVAAALAADRLAMWVGEAGQVTAERLTAAVRALCRGEQRLDTRHGQHVCDGAGTARVVAAMFGSSQAEGSAQSA